MKLLIVIPHFFTGGAQRMLELLLPRLALYDDLEITLCLYQNSDHSPMTAGIRRNPHIKVKIIGMPVSRKEAINPFVRVKVIRKLRELMKEADVCHVHLFPALYDAAIAARGLPLKLIFTNHNTSNRRRHYPYLRYIERKIYSRYDAITCISPATARSLTDWLRTDPQDERFEVIYGGIDFAAFNSPHFNASHSGPLNAGESTLEIPENISDMIDLFEAGPDIFLQRRLRRAGISSVKDIFGREGHAILMISRFVKSKDHESLIRALHILKTDPEYVGRIPADIFLAFAGSGEMMPAMKELAEELNLTDDVVFLGDRNDIPCLIAAASAGAQISHWEGFGLTAFEIMAGETPLIASNVKGMAEIVKESARLVEPESPESIAGAIADILAPDSPDMLHDTLIRQMQGVKTARRFDIRYTLESYLQLYRRISIER